MKIFLRVLRFIGFVLYAIAASSLGYGLYVVGHRFTVFERHVQVIEGNSFSETFTVDRAEMYALGVKCRKTIAFDALNNALLHDLAVTFSVHDGTTLVDDNTFPRQEGGAWARNFIFRGFGRFEAKPFHTYRLDVHFTHSLPLLASTDPVVLVEIEPSHASDAYVAFDILVLLTIAATVVGTVLVLPHYACTGKRRDRS